MKHFFSTVLALSIFFMLLTTHAKAEQPRILASTFPVYQLSRIITNGADVKVDIMIPAQMGCPHDYALSPHDMRKLAQANIFVINGLGLEEFLGERFKQENPNLHIIDSSLGITDLLPYESDNGDDGHKHNLEINPHIFASPRMLAQMALSISRQLSAIDQDRAKIYTKNAAAYAAELRQLADDMDIISAKFINKNCLAQHEVFDYLARDLSLNIVAVVQEHEGQEPSAARIFDLLRIAKEKKVAAIFAEPQYTQQTAMTIAKEAKISFAVIDPVASGPENAPLDYFVKIMSHNIDILEQTLGNK